MSYSYTTMQAFYDRKLVLDQDVEHALAEAAAHPEWTNRQLLDKINNDVCNLTTRYKNFLDTSIATAMLQNAIETRTNKHGRKPEYLYPSLKMIKKGNLCIGSWVQSGVVSGILCERKFGQQRHVRYKISAASYSGREGVRVTYIMKPISNILPVTGREVKIKRYATRCLHRVLRNFITHCLYKPGGLRMRKAETHFYRSAAEQKTIKKIKLR